LIFRRLHSLLRRTVSMRRSIGVCAVMRCLPCKRDVSRAARLAAGTLRAILGLSLVAVDIARAIVVLRVVVLLLLMLLLVLSNLAVGDRRNGRESMRRVHTYRCCGASGQSVRNGKRSAERGMTYEYLWRQPFLQTSLRYWVVCGRVGSFSWCDYRQTFASAQGLASGC